MEIEVEALQLLTEPVGFIETPQVCGQTVGCVLTIWFTNDQY
ncbi:hypothetical protein ACIGXA_33550 [Streptomyces fildesensis]|uniref:Uncharacterized protein n=1 Tax=Streptomyces fildesensis TaxID=375757 RepID=A0ABW8CJ95_9ACTN